MSDQCKKPWPRERMLLLVDCALILLAFAFLIAPLWGIEYLRNWGSIDSTFIADARFLKADRGQDGLQGASKVLKLS